MADSVRTTAPVQIEQKSWGKARGVPCELFRLKNGSLEVEITNYGARLLRVKSPDREGKMEDIVLGFDTLEEYLLDETFQGATVGRYGNRIAGGSFLLDGRTYEITHTGKHALHGGTEGYDRRIWTSSVLSNGVLMKLISPDGDMGFPGELHVNLSYTLQDESLHIRFEANTDCATILNLTNHAYFNLAGEDRGDILAHSVSIAADRFASIDGEAIPTGDLPLVDGTPFDLRALTPIELAIGSDHLQMVLGDGFNHNFVLGEVSDSPRFAAEVYDPSSGRTLTVHTTEPGVQFYTGNALGGQTGRHGEIYGRHKGLCLETQHFPDSPHHAHFPSTILRPQDEFVSETVFTFDAR